LKTTCANCVGLLLIGKLSPFAMVAQFPSPHLWTAARSCMSSSSDHVFRFLLDAKLPPTNPLDSIPSVGGTGCVGNVCLWTVTGKTMFVPCIKLEGCELSIRVLDEWQTGTFIVNGASIVELLGAESLSVREAIITWWIKIPKNRRFKIEYQEKTQFKV